MAASLFHFMSRPVHARRIQRCIVENTKTSAYYWYNPSRGYQSNVEITTVCVRSCYERTGTVVIIV